MAMFSAEIRTQFLVQIQFCILLSKGLDFVSTSDTYSICVAEELCMSSWVDI